MNNFEKGVKMAKQTVVDRIIDGIVAKDIKLVSLHKDAREVASMLSGMSEERAKKILSEIDKEFAKKIGTEIGLLIDKGKRLRDFIHDL